MGTALLLLNSCTKAELIGARGLASAIHSVLEELTLSSPSTVVSAGGTLPFSAQGGTPPYAFQVVSGGGSINASTGLYQAPTVPGSALIRLTDLRGVTRDASITIQPGAPFHLLLNGATSLTAGDCSPYTITQKDVFGNLANTASTSTTVNFTGSASSVFYSDSSCSISTSSASIPAGSGSITIYLRDTKAESFTFTASATGLTSSSLSIIIQAGPPAKLALTGPTSVLVNGCSSAYTITSKDTYGNTSPLSSGGSVTLTGGGSGTFYSDSGCGTPVSSVNIGSGSSNANFYFKDVASEALTLDTSTTGLTDGSLGVSIQTQLVISGPALLIAGTCGTFTVTSKDATGATFAVPVDTTLSIYNPTASYRYETFYSDASCSTPIGTSYSSGNLTMLTGNSSVIFYAKILRAGSTQLIIGGSSSLSTGGPAFNFTVAPTTESLLTITGPSFIQPNTCSAAYTVTAMDAYKNISPVSSDTTVNLTNDGTGGGFYVDDACTVPISDVTLLSGTSAMQFYFMDSNTELVNLSASATGLASGSFLADISNTTPTILSAGSGAHGCAIVNGAVKCWGLGGYLGNNSNVSSLTPVQAMGITSGATAISASGSEATHTCAVVNSGAMCWGDIDYGALGTGSASSGAVPAQVIGLTSGVTAIATGGGTSCAIVNGGAWCWGANNSGQLGNNSTTSTTVPVAVQGLSSGVTSIATGPAHSCAVVNGAAMCWGSSGYGALGDGTGIDSLVPVQVQGLTSGVTAIAVGRVFSCAIVGGGVKCWGIGTSNTPITVGGLSGNVTNLAVSEFNACAVDNGAAKCWGTSSSPVAASIPGLSSGVQSVSVGTIRGNSPVVCATTGDGLHCWGNNDVGQLGNGAITDSPNTPMSFLSLN
jgi:alpha-tubulin suppressor-like RCC1 family protein